MPRNKKPSKKSLDPLPKAGKFPMPNMPGWNFSFYERVIGIDDRIEGLVNSVRGFPQQKRFEQFGQKLNGLSPLERIDHCSQALMSGALPDTETLEFVAIALNKYVCSDGTLSLDEAFGLKSKPKAGNPVRQEIRRNKLTGFLLDMARFRRHDPQRTMASAAEAALHGDESISVETLEREYRRRGYDKFARPRGK